MQELQERKTKLLSTIKSELSFLVSDFQFTESLETENDENSSGPEYYFLRYTNQKNKKQLEVLLHGKSDYKLVTLKRIEIDLIPSYYDLTNTIKIEDLDLFYSPDTFSYQNHIAYSEEDKINYFAEIATKIRKEWIDFVIGESWFDRAKLDALYQSKKFIRESGFRKDKMISKIVEEVRFLEKHQYEIIINSNEKNPYKYTSHSVLILHNKIKDIYLKFNVSYKNKVLSFERKNAKHQSYRLLEFLQIQSENNDVKLEGLIEGWVNSELKIGGI